jgi:hypothetical protein
MTLKYLNLTNLMDMLNESDGQYLEKKTTLFVLHVFELRPSCLVSLFFSVFVSAYCPVRLVS